MQRVIDEECISRGTDVSSNIKRKKVVAYSDGHFCSLEIP